MNILLQSGDVKWLETPDRAHLYIFDINNERVYLYIKKGGDLLLLKKWLVGGSG
jgi:hypothetical protein